MSFPEYEHQWQAVMDDMQDELSKLHQTLDQLETLVNEAAEFQEYYVYYVERMQEIISEFRSVSDGSTPNDEPSLNRAG